MSDNKNEMTLALEFNRQQTLLLDAAMDKIRHCTSQLTEAQIWARSNPASNSIGNLLLHIAGNLRQWATVPATGAVDARDRGSEFAAMEMPKSELLEKLEHCVAEAKQSIENGENGSPEALLTRHSVQGFDVTLMAALVHTTSHFVGHTHQIILLTRQMLGDAYDFHWRSDSPRGQVPI